MVSLRILNAKQSIQFFKRETDREKYSGYYVYVRTIDEYRTAIYYNMIPFKNVNLLTRALFYNDMQLFDELNKLVNRSEIYGNEKKLITEVYFPWNDTTKLHHPFRQFCTISELMVIILEHDKLDQLFLMKDIESDIIFDVDYAYQFVLLKMMGFKNVVPKLHCPIVSLMFIIDYCFYNDMMEDVLFIYRYIASHSKQVRSYIRKRLGTKIHDYLDQRDCSDGSAIRNLVMRNNSDEIKRFIGANGLVFEIIENNRESHWDQFSDENYHGNMDILVMNRIICNAQFHGLTAAQTLSRDVPVDSNIIKEEHSFSQYNISLGIERKIIHNNAELLFYNMYLPNDIDVRQFKGKSEIIDYLISRFYCESAKRAVGN
jgi:hypothetical protein